MYLYKAKILSVYDGDSCTALIDLGCYVSIQRPIRLYGINAPELRGETKLAGLEARDFLSSHILNKEVFIRTFKDKNEKYGRLLGQIFMSDPTTGDALLINDLMISSGHAVVYEE